MDFEFSTVDEKEKKGFISMLFVMLGFTFFSASMWTGGNLGSGLSFKSFIIAVLIGNTILGVYTGVLAYMGAKTGLSTHMIAKKVFGQKGAHLCSLLLAITQIGWFGVGVAMFAIPVHKYTGIDMNLLIIISGFLMTGTAYFGMKALLILSIVAVPSITFLGLTSVNMAINSVGGINSFMAIEPLSKMSMILAITLVIGSFISGGTLTADFTRYSKSPKKAVIATGIAFFLGNSLMFLFGAVGSKIFQTADISDVMYAQGLLLPAIIILGFNIWTTNDNAIYASGLGLAVITKIPKRKIVVFCGIIGTLLALPLYNNFVGWLNILNVFLPPIGALLITDFYFVSRKNITVENIKNTSDYNYKALFSYAVGIIASFYLPFVPALSGMICSGFLYIISLKINFSKNTVGEIYENN